MLCSSCRRQVSRDSSWCTSCGAPLAGEGAPLELVLADATRVPVTGELVIGRAPGNTLQLADPSVSRRHARIVVTPEETTIEDLESKNGTLVNGDRLTQTTVLKDGDEILIGSVMVTYRLIDVIPSTRTLRRE